MNCKSKAEWARLLCRTEACLNAGLVPHLTDAECQSLAVHKPTIKEWVRTDRILEMRPSVRHDWVGVGEAVVGFHPYREYRIQPKEDNSVEQYSKEFWQQCLNMHTMHLSDSVGGAVSYHAKHIAAWAGGVALERYANDQWVTVPPEHHRFLAKWQYREATPKLKQCDVVVYYRDALEVGRGGALRSRFIIPAGIDVARLPVDAPTLAKLQAKTSGFKLLSITRVAVDENHNLTEYSTKLDNLGRVPF